MSINQPQPLSGEVVGVDPATGTGVEATKPNALAVVGLILALLIPPLGFIASVLAFFLATRGGLKGKRIAIGGMITAILVSLAWTAAIIFVISHITTVVNAGG